jgi:hypothetical protein
LTTVTATRSELLARRTREDIARRGHALLTQKRAALIGELRRVGLEVGDKRAELERAAAAARRALRQAVVTDGPQAVASAAVAASRPVSAEVTSRSVAGVPARTPSRAASRSCCAPGSCCARTSCSSRPTTVVVAGFFLAYQQLENYLIAPRILRTTVSLSAAAVLLAGLIGGAALGLVGAVMAIPVAAGLKVVLTDRLQARDDSSAQASRDRAAPAQAEPAEECPR